ncbi:M56 family metallopeptidase [Cyclobacterium qasimii]|uniref:TonB n=2 Tax=Cyclobacterium qasimii TaxID=1350429 RepID=S7VJ12_9BACT|nr:M56 family metallopeptidase [Cyclobacterium qasimii]EPR70180.1 TonB [Cyclobacterium qasimii M12-11B]GEO22355.1 hypothetical protein CQA01_28890 [Cyclobacterium qasimii]
MEAFFLYLLKVSLATAIFYLTYHFLFRVKKQFVFNRYYLLLILPVAHIIPLISFPTAADLSLATVYFNEINPLPIGEPSFTPNNNGNATFNWLSVLSIIYVSGMVFFLIRFIISYIQASAIQKVSQQDIIDNQTVYLSERNIRAFTFIDKIIIGRNILDHPSLKMVIDHEKVHLKEKHFIDLFTIEFLSSFQWFNPFAIVLNKAIRLNLEYRADDMVVQHSNMRQYQMALISMVSDRIAFPQFTELNSNNLQNRIMMMKSQNESKFSRIRKLAVLPIFLILLAGLSEKTPTIKASDGIEPNIKASDTAISSISDLNRYFSKSLMYPQEARKSGQVGLVTLFFKIDNNGKLTGVYETQPSRKVYYYPEGSLKYNPFNGYTEIVIVGYESDPLKINESKYHSSLFEECKRVINDLPTLNIGELKGRTVKIKFKFKIVKS